MAKLSKAAVKGRVAEYAALRAKIVKIEDAQNKDLEPYLEQYDRETKTVFAKYEKKLEPLRASADEIEAEIYGFLNAQDKDVEIEADGFVAERKTQSKLGARVIDVKQFLERAKKKGEAMFACISIGVKKAEDLLGKEIDEISSRPENWTVTTAIRTK
ncbi:MAG TPA: hypothetical protein PLD38_15925 [Pyrinomonadaceae bacterium]|nr:hypothetical protein [Pyrinomonadaceae bacterium]